MDRRPARVVVEVDVHVLPARPLRRQPLLPGPQLRAAVPGPRLRRSLVQPQVPPAGRPPQRPRGRPAPVRPHQRGLPAGEDLPHLVRPAGLVPHLHRDPQPGRPGPAEFGQRLVQQSRVTFPRRRQLQQDRPQRGPQPGRRAHQPAHRLGRFLQPPDVRQVPAGLDRHHEPGRGPLRPRRERLPRRQPVERVVVLHGGELFRVELQPPPLRNARRVQHPPPVPVLPSRRPDQPRHAPRLYDPPRERPLCGQRFRGIALRTLPTSPEERV